MAALQIWQMQLGSRSANYLKFSYTDSYGRDASPLQVHSQQCGTRLQLRKLIGVNEIP